MSLKLCRQQKVGGSNTCTYKIKGNIKDYIERTLILKGFIIEEITVRIYDVDKGEDSFEEVTSFHEYKKFVNSGNLKVSFFKGKYDNEPAEIYIHHYSSMLIIIADEEIVDNITEEYNYAIR